MCILYYVKRNVAVESCQSTCSIFLYKIMREKASFLQRHFTQEGKSVVFTTTLIECSGFNSSPWSHCCVFGEDALRGLSVLGSFEQAANSVDKSKKSKGTLDHRKLLIPGADSSDHEVVIATKNVRIVQQISV